MQVKICGVTHPDDAFAAARLGADYVGIIFAELSKRKVAPSLAKEIAKAIRDAGAEPIAVFAEQTAEHIETLCEAININTVQLHGAISKQACHRLIKKYTIFYALTVNEHKIPEGVIPLYDKHQGGSGQTFDWDLFNPPSNRKWILAGGLNPQNVKKAIKLLHPDIVDVSTGVEIPGQIRKDHNLIAAFIQNAKEKP